MKKIFALLVLVVSIFALSACNNKTLTTASMFGGTDSAAGAYQELIDEFAEATGWKVKDSSETSSEEWKASIVASFNAGNEADVLFYFNGATASSFVKAGKVVSVADIRKEYPDYAKNISPSVLDPYCVPVTGFVEGMFINTSLFTTDALKEYVKEANIKWTWDDLKTVIGLLKEAGVAAPIAFSAAEPHYWIEHILLGSLGPDFLSSIPAGSKFDTPRDAAAEKWVNALALIKELGDLGAFGTPNGSESPDTIKTAFAKGQSAIYLDGSWAAGNWKGSDHTEENKATHDNVIAIPFPSIPEEKGGTGKWYMQSGYTSGFYISKKAWDNKAKREMAVKFVETMTSTAGIKKISEANGSFPADPSVEKDGSTKLEKGLAKLSSYTSAAVLPLSDACKANTFVNLVEVAAAMVSGDKDIIAGGLKKFSNAQ